MMEQSLLLEDLRLEHFTPLVGQLFCVSYPEVSEQLRLEAAEVAPGSGSYPDHFRKPFSLVFSGLTPNLVLHQQIHPVSHPAIGCLGIFLVPNGYNADGTLRYQAGFN